jgi:hypothetical protein
MMSLVIDVKATMQLLKPELKGALLFSHDKALLNEYFNDLVRYNGFTNAQRQLLKDFKDNQTRIIQYLRNKYHFE